MDWQRISLQAADDFLDFSGVRRGDPHWDRIAERQLRGTVALYNRLSGQRLAWLADEVGMGKTFIALGIAALLRHQNPQARVLYLLPSSRLQPKWEKEVGRFTRNIIKRVDHRARTLQDKAARPLVQVRRLVDLGLKTVTDPEQDFMAPLSAFSFALGQDSTRWKEPWKRLQTLSPALPCTLPDWCYANKKVFKEVFAAALNAVLPHFDLVICDESHNLRAGAGHGAARNRAVAIALGGHKPNLDHPLPWERPVTPRVERLLCLTATPVEHDFSEMARQAEVFGLHEETLPDATSAAIARLRKRGEEGRKNTARSLVVRRLHELHTASTTEDESLTKNMYRREWRQGGLNDHDHPLPQAAPKERLLVALVQKHVLDVLEQEGHSSAERAAMPSFQMGMLSSFESFSETLKGRKKDETTFDGEDQTRDRKQRMGIDSATIDAICKSYRKQFGVAPPHPKMDQVAQQLSVWAQQGDKSLVFVRRVRTTEELADKVGQLLSEQLNTSIGDDLPEGLKPTWAEIVSTWRQTRRTQTGARPLASSGTDDTDPGGEDTLFAWFFRGDGQSNHHANHPTGARLRRRCFQSATHPWSTFFHEDHVSWLLGEETTDWVQARTFPLEVGARRWLAGRQSVGLRHRFEAWQAAALELIAAESLDRTRARCAGWLRAQLYPYPSSGSYIGDIGQPGNYIGLPTFFTALRKSTLCAELWPNANDIHSPETREGRLALQEREIRRALMSSVLRLGNPTVLLWLASVTLTGSLEPPTGQEATNIAGLAAHVLALLTKQREGNSEHHNAWRELSLLAQHHAVITDVNFPDVVERELHELPRFFQRYLSRQSPVVAMHGGHKSPQAMAQFRMPGYPMVLVATDVLQEGVDLHTFCARVIHYGIAHTSGATEQRTGRVDRIASLVHRRIDPGAPGSMLQVHYPHLMDTIEPLQMQVLYRRMDRFLKLVHDGLGSPEDEPSTVSVEPGEIAYPTPPKGRLRSAFQVQEADLSGGPLDPDIDISFDRADIEATMKRYCQSWMPDPGRPRWRGEARVRDDVLLDLNQEDIEDTDRRQPVYVSVHTRRDGRGLLIRVDSPIGSIDLSDGRTAGSMLRLQEQLRGARLTQSHTHKRRTWLTVRCELPLSSDADMPALLTQALNTAAVQADWIEREYIGPDQDLSLSETGEW